MKNHHVAAARRAAKSRRRLAQVRQQERLAGDQIPGPGEKPTPEREASASSQAPLTAKHIETGWRVYVWTCVPPLPAPPGQTAQCTTTFDSTTLSNGPHTIEVRAYNAAGEMVSDRVDVIVNNLPTPSLRVAP